jgi:hypothetical protein
MPVSAAALADATAQAPSLVDGVVRDRKELARLLLQVYPGSVDLNSQVELLMGTWLEERRQFFSPQPHGAQMAWLRWIALVEDPLVATESITVLLNAIANGDRITGRVRSLLENLYFGFTGRRRSNGHDDNTGERLQAFNQRELLEARDMASKIRAYKYNQRYHLPLDMVPAEEVLSAPFPAGYVMDHVANGVGVHTFVPGLRAQMEQLDMQLAVWGNLNGTTFDLERYLAAVSERNGLLVQERDVIAAYMQQQRLETNLRNHPYLIDKLAAEPVDGNAAYKRDLFVAALREASPRPPSKREREEAAETRRERMRDMFCDGRRPAKFGKSALFFA